MTAAASEESKENADSGSSGSGGGGNKLVLILTGVNTVAVLAMVAVLFVSFQKDKKHSSVDDISVATSTQESGAKGGGVHGEAKGDEKSAGGARKKASEFGKMVTLEQFTVNLATPGSVNPKFVRVNISLEVPNEDAEAEVNLKMPQVRNVVIDLFNSKRPADLATAEGRDYLKDEIRTAINTFLVTGKVKGVFFTNFALSS